jgi:hypothetical protein
MIAVKNPIINGIDISKYKEHPRMLELRMVLQFTIISTEYGHNKAMFIYQKLCEIFRVDFAKISTVLNALPSVTMLSRKNKWRYRQEVMVLGKLYNETRVDAGSKYLQKHATTIYRYPEFYDPNIYVNEEWLGGLDETVAICGVETYRLEVLRFIEDFEFFLEVMGNISLSKEDIRSIRYDHKLR